MSRLGPAARVVVSIVVACLLSGGGFAPTVRAAAPDKSEVALVLDFSSSILNDKANRERFAAALERIADRVDETSADLVAGDSTMSIVQFAATAADYPGCVELHTLNSPETVAKFADCVRSVASAYRKGPDAALEKRIGTDTNYVAAMQQAAKHLPADAVRPALILLTDGKHDVKGVPLSQVQAVRDQLFGNRSPIALLPVGMGLQPSERAALEAGLVKLGIIKDMPACVSGATFEWPQVVFDTADEAGNAVAVALQDATCTFTVAVPSPAATATPEPTPTPAPPAVPVVRSIRLTPLDGRIEVVWSAPIATGAAASPVPVVDYKVRCRAGDGPPIESTEGVSLERQAVVEGLTNGTAYQCEVATVTAAGDGPWTAAAATATPTGRPPAPGKPAVAALDRALEISLPSDDPGNVSGIHYECSNDNGATWSAEVDVASPDKTTAQLLGLQNGKDYVCRAFAVSSAGQSDASPLSDAVRPCGSPLECNPTLAPAIFGLGVVLLGGLVLVVGALLRSRRRGYVLAVVDVVHTANLGYGTRLGIGIVHDADSKQVTDVVADRGKTADIRIRHLGHGRFVVTDKRGRHEATDGEPLIVVDSLGARHEVVLRAFNTKAASPVSTRT